MRRATRLAGLITYYLGPESFFILFGFGFRSCHCARVLRPSFAQISLTTVCSPPFFIIVSFHDARVRRSYRDDQNNNNCLFSEYYALVSLTAMQNIHPEPYSQRTVPENSHGLSTAISQSCVHPLRWQTEKGNNSLLRRPERHSPRPRSRLFVLPHSPSQLRVHAKLANSMTSGLEAPNVTWKTPKCRTETACRECRGLEARDPWRTVSRLHVRGGIHRPLQVRGGPL